MSGDDQDDRPPGQRRKRAFAAGVALTVLGVAGIWVQRTPIATQMIDRELAKRGVPARYTILRLDTQGATLGGLVIGNPAAPDLVASRLRVRIGWNLTSADIVEVALEDALVRGRVDQNGLSLGTLDQLRPEPTGKPFALPDLALGLKNVRLHLATAAGKIGLTANGSGNLASGFGGQLLISAPRIQQQDCMMTAGKAVLDISTRARTITAAGPLGAAGAACAGVRTGPMTARLSATLPETLDSAKGRLNLSARKIAHDSGNGVSLIAADGNFILAAGPQAAFDGAVRWEGIRGSPQLQQRIGKSAASLSATPVGPIAKRVTGAMARALNEVNGSAQVALASRRKAGRISVSNLGARAASGAQLTTNGRVLAWNWPADAIQLDGKMALSGGGLPEVRAEVRPAGPKASQILASMLPYAAGNARLALSPVRIDWNGTTGEIATQAKIDGPLPGGYVQGLSIPIGARFGSDGTVSVHGQQGCLDTRFTRLDINGVRMGESRLPLCSSKGTLFAIDRSARLSGDAGAVRIALKGNLGETPLAIDAANPRIAFSGTSASPRVNFQLGRSAVSLKQPAGETWLKLAELTGATSTKGAEGTLTDASGAISAVPLLVDQASGRWRYGGGVLTLDAPSARVRDAAINRRFEPVSARDVRLTLKQGIITGKAVLTHPPNGKQLALLSLTHDLSASRGNAVLDVPELRFGDDLQPEALTPLTLGIIANTGGAITGKGNIRWSSAGVTSDGVFETGGIGVSAAFGQVHNIKGRIVFDDLLGMTTPPGQMVTIGEMNPGVSVKDGVIRYQLLPGQHVKVEGGQWPFAGGELFLEPTVLDFSKPSDRIFALTVTGLDAAQFIQQFDFKNFAVTGLFDGRLPLVFDAHGGRIVGGRLVSRKEGGTLAYVGEVSDAALGGAGKLAFDALKSMKYNALVIEMDGQLDGEIISTVLFNGSNQAPVNPTGAALPVQATGLPFKFNITVRAPFRALLSTAQSFTDVRSTVRAAMPANPDDVPGSAPVQPPESEDKR